jgi:hypothetical protein
MNLINGQKANTMNIEKYGTNRYQCTAKVNICSCFKVAGTDHCGGAGSISASHSVNDPC